MTALVRTETVLLFSTFVAADPNIYYSIQLMFLSDSDLTLRRIMPAEIHFSNPKGYLESLLATHSKHKSSV